MVYCFAVTLMTSPTDRAYVPLVTLARCPQERLGCPPTSALALAAGCLMLFVAAVVVAAVVVAAVVVAVVVRLLMFFGIAFARSPEFFFSKST
jgi:hypothetical protein